MIDIKSKKLILLTGAGFTKNFGGFLGREMWSKIYNNSKLQKLSKLRELLQENDYESAYTTVMNGEKYDSKEKNTMLEVIEEVYESLDRNIRLVGSGGMWNDILNLFIGDENEKGLFFTLNQDLFFERHKNYRSPGVPKFSDRFTPGANLIKEFFVQVPKDNAEELIKKDIENHVGLHYIKLHGSYGWKSSNGLNQMVIGKEKKKDIINEPLLTHYFEIFDKAISDGNKKLLIIGYGFNDQHINELLIKGVNHHSLKLYVLMPMEISEFRYYLDYGRNYVTNAVFKGLSGFFPYTLNEAQSSSESIKEIKDSLLA